MIPSDRQIRIPSAFAPWMSYPATLRIGDATLTIGLHGIDLEWSRNRDLRSLQRYEDGDRFGRAIFAIQYAPGTWAGIHGEHLRIQGGTDESNGTSLEMWAAPDEARHTTLGQTMRAKSKDGEIKASGYEPALPMGFAIVTHDRNPDPARTPWHWFGFADAPPEPPPSELPPVLVDAVYVAPSDAELDVLIRRILRRLLR